MYTKNFLAAGALISAVAAVPMAKRDLVWVTETDESVVTVPVTTTIWVNPGETVPAAAPTADAAPSHYGHHRHSSPAAPSASAASAPAPSAPAPPPAPSSYAVPSPSSVYVAPSSSSVYVAPSSSSVYVAPSSSTTSVYVAPTTSSTSVWVAPTTSTSVWVAPTTSQAATSTYEAPAAAASCTNSNSGSSLSGAAAAGTSYSGDLTYYTPGMGACGCTSAEGDHIVAISESLFDQYMPSSGNPNMNPLCGRQVSITGKDGSAYTATIVDRCTGCKEADLDLTESFFNTVTNNGDGRVHNMAWSIMN